MEQNNQMSRFSRAIKFENEQRRLRYIDDTQALAKKHVELQEQWNAFSGSTGLPERFNSDLESGKIMSSAEAEAFEIARLEFDRSVHSYFAQHEETLRAIGNGQLYQHERQLGVPLPVIARQDTPEARGFQELMKYDIYGPTEQQKIEIANLKVHQMNQRAKSDLRELAGKYKELEESWSNVTEEMGLDDIVFSEKEEFKHYVELKQEVEAATTAYWKEHGWRHEQDAQAGMAAEVGDFQTAVQKHIYPEIKADDGHVISEDARKIFRAEIESAAATRGLELTSHEAASTQPSTLAVMDMKVEEELQADFAQAQPVRSSPAPILDIRPDRLAPVEHLNEVSVAPEFTPLSEDGEAWARNNVFTAEHLQEHGAGNWAALEERIRTADLEARADQLPRVDRATHELHAKFDAQRAKNIAAGMGSPDAQSIQLGNDIKRNLQQAGVARQAQVAARRDNEFALAA